MNELGDKRKLFTRLFAKLIQKMVDLEFQPMNGRDGQPHMQNSLHYEGLAMDVDLCDSDGAYLDKTEYHKQFGDYWKSLHPDCRWGGDFKKPDGNHYSITYGERS